MAEHNTWLPAPPGWVWVQVEMSSAAVAAPRREVSGVYPVAYFEQFTDTEFATTYARPVVCRDYAILEVVPSAWLEVPAGPGSVRFYDGAWRGAALVGPADQGASSVLDKLRSAVQARWVVDPLGERVAS